MVNEDTQITCTQNSHRIVSQHISSIITSTYLHLLPVLLLFALCGYNLNAMRHNNRHITTIIITFNTYGHYTSASNDFVFMFMFVCMIREDLCPPVTNKDESPNKNTV